MIKVFVMLKFKLIFCMCDSCWYIIIVLVIRMVEVVNWKIISFLWSSCFVCLCDNLFFSIEVGW